MNKKHVTDLSDIQLVKEFEKACKFHHDKTHNIGEKPLYPLDWLKQELLDRLQYESGGIIMDEDFRYVINLGNSKYFIGFQTETNWDNPKYNISVSEGDLLDAMLLRYNMTHDLSYLYKLRNNGFPHAFYQKVIMEIID